jgi:hypothetical protein
VTSAIRFARRVYTGAGLYGLLVLLPMYFTVDQTGRDYPPVITHLEYYYGFVGVAIAWQLAFLVIGRDPVRFRPIMPVTFVEKVIFAVPATVMFARGALPPPIMAGAVIDLVLCTLFVAAYVRTAADAGR